MRGLSDNHCYPLNGLQGFSGGTNMLSGACQCHTHPQLTTRINEAIHFEFQGWSEPVSRLRFV